MALINHRTREIHFKIVYYGPGLCGKTTNLKALHDKLPAERRGKLISIATDQERTLFFDFLPIDLGQVNGFLTRFHLYTVPGQIYYRLSRRAVLQGVDGLVFVADSHPGREAANRESLADLREHLTTIGITGPALARIPWVFQWNKRDLPLPVPTARLHEALNPLGWPEYEAIASTGAGVSETLRAACKAVLARLGGAPTGPPVAAPVAAVAPVAVAAAAAMASAPSAAPAASVPAPASPMAAPAAPSAAPVPPRTPLAPVAARPLAPAAARAPARQTAPTMRAALPPRPATPFFARPAAPAAMPTARPRALPPLPPLPPMRKPEGSK